MLCFYCKNINERGLTQEQVMNKLIISCNTDVAVCRACGHVSLSFPQIKGLKIHNTSLYKLHNTSLYKLLTLQSLLTFYFNSDTSMLLPENQNWNTIT
jgi:hypothetical protein